MNFYLKKYTFEEIHSYLITKNIALLNSFICENKEDLLNVPENINNEYSRLKNLGLINTKNAKILESRINKINDENNKIEEYNNSIEKQEELKTFLKELLEVFGNKVILISYLDFEYLLRKYNLTCGLLHNYIGSIPEKNIEELEIVNEKINTVISSWEYCSSEDKNYCKYDNSLIFNIGNTPPTYPNRRIVFRYPRLIKYIKKLLLITEIQDYHIDKLSSNEFNSIKLFPFLIEDKTGEFTGDYYTAMSSLRFRTSFYGIKTFYKSSRLFIAAPSNEMNNSFKVRKFVRTEDPFICSYTPFGIIVYSKWGSESEDEILEKYYNLMD